MPVTGPAFVHDLGLSLRREVISLVSDDREDIKLPRLERSVLQDKQHHISYRLARKFLIRLLRLLLGIHHIGRIDELIHITFGPKASHLPQFLVVFLPFFFVVLVLAEELVLMGVISAFDER